MILGTDHGPIPGERILPEIEYQIMQMAHLIDELIDWPSDRSIRPLINIS
jgi:hypothetical protein